MSATDQKKEITNYTEFTSYPATHEQLGTLKRTICKEYTDAEFFLFMDIAASLKLNPLVNEIWPLKIDGAVKPFVGRDGLRTNAERSGDFVSIQSGAIYENDVYTVNKVTGEVKHEAAHPKDRGKLVGSWTKVCRKNFPPVFVEVLFEEYKKDNKAWKERPEKMCIKCSESNALKMAFPMSGVIIDEDIDLSKMKKQKDDSFISDAEVDDQKSEYDELYEDLFNLVVSSKSKDKEYYKKRIIKEKEDGKLTLDAIKDWIETLKNDQ